MASVSNEDPGFTQSKPVENKNENFNLQSKIVQ